jgi:molybdate transport system substrate-binding protein
VVVFAAASLTDVFSDIERAFEAAHPELDAVVSLGASSTLREQVLDGAPADVIATAGQPVMDQLVDAGVIDGPPIVFGANRLSLAVPAGNPGRVTGVDDLADPELLIGLCDEAVPCGALAREALATVGVVPSLDTAEPDVRALLAKLAAGELDAGLVYATDIAAANGAVTAIDLPAPAALGLDYPAAVLASGPNPAGARTFVEFVTSPAGRDVLVAGGFGP